MTSPGAPMTFNGKIVNLQIVLGGSPTINNLAQPPETPRSARPTPHSSRSVSPSMQDSPRVSSPAQGHSTITASHRHHLRAGAPIPFPSPPLQPSPYSSSLLSPIGSPVANLNSLQPHAVVAHSSRESSATEGSITHSLSSATYAHSNVGRSRLLDHERVGNNLYPHHDRTTNIYGSAPRVSFPAPSLPHYSFSDLFERSASPPPWPMPEPDRCDWWIDEREDVDYSVEGYR